MATGEGKAGGVKNSRGVIGRHVFVAIVAFLIVCLFPVPQAHALEYAVRDVPLCFDKNDPFSSRLPGIEHELRSALLSATVLDEPYVYLGKRIKGDEYDNTAYWSNLTPAASRRLTGLVCKMAPRFRKKEFGLAVLKSDLDLDGEPEMVLSVREHAKYDDYLHIVIFRWDGARYKRDMFGVFLVGEVVAIRRFGPNGHKCVLFTWDSCTECEPTTYMGFVEACASPYKDCMYSFNWGKEYGGWHVCAEYAQYKPKVYGAAFVSTRVPDAFLPGGPHLLQQFTYDRSSPDETRQDEYWIYRCASLKCEAEIHKGKMPEEFRILWKDARAINRHRYE